MSSKVFISDSRTFQQDVLQAHLPVAVYFYSEDCPPCSTFDPIFDRMALKYSDKMRFVKIFSQQNRQLAESENVKSSPTLLFFKDGQEACSRLNGYISRPELQEVIEGVIGGSCILRERGKVYCDVLILGAGPAGLSAAIYAARAKLFTVVADEGLPGGQVATTYHVANYPGTNGVIRGIDLMENMQRQAVGFGAQLDDMQEIMEVNLEGGTKHIRAERTDYFAKTVIIATGAQPRKLPAEGENEFRGRGVHYCAACDGALYQDAELLVVGGGNSALEGAIFLTRYAKSVTIVHRLDHFQASRAVQEAVFHNPNIQVLRDSQIQKVFGDSFVKGAMLENLKSGELKEISTDGVFVYIGQQPKTSMFNGKVNMNGDGYIITDESMNTNVAGVFAAGDVRDKKIRQIATAAGDGTIAGIMVEKYIR